MAFEGSYIGLDLATLNDLKASFVECLKAIATAGQSYTIGGRTFTRADITAVERQIKEITQAIAMKTGKRVRRVYPDFSRSRNL